MKLYKRTVVALLMLLSCSLSQANAGNSWWEKGLDIYDAFDGETVTKDLDLDEISTAFKQALRIGSENVVEQLGTLDGFNNDAAIHIPLPDELQTVKELLTQFGMSAIVDDLELKLNRAAEMATPKAKELFMQAITDMSFEDINTIYKGPNDSATNYFQQKMSTALSAEMRPIVDNSLAEVGALQAYDSVMGSYQTLPFVPDIKANLTDHVVEKGMDGIFYYIAKEEEAIREDPAKQTTALLKKVFGVK